MRIVSPLALLAALAVLAAPSKEPKAKAQDGVRDLPAFLGPLPRVKVPDDNSMSAEKVELGRLLFFDPRLSGNGTLSFFRTHGEVVRGKILYRRPKVIPVYLSSSYPLVPTLLFSFARH